MMGITARLHCDGAARLRRKEAQTVRFRHGLFKSGMVYNDTRASEILRVLQLENLV
jgi:hypothetical protein